MNRIFITIILLFIGFLPLSGQEVNLRFQHITSEQGLSQNTIGCMLQDSRGFMWFGTWNGLDRYDGYNFLTFKSENQQGGLSNNFIYSICEDKEGNIWAGTKNGLNKIDHQTNAITTFIHDPDLANSISGNTINALYCDRNGSVWVGTSTNGLDKITFDRALGKYLFTHFRYDKSDQLSIPGNEINSILEDKSGFLWVGTNSGLGRMDLASGRFEVFRNNNLINNSISSNGILAIFEDKAGIIWLGTNNGLDKFNAGSGDFVRYLPNPDNPGSISHLTVKAISEDIDGRLLVGTLGGLDLFNPVNGSFYHFPVGQNDNFSLNNEFINALFADRQGNIWIGTDKGGISKYNGKQKGFGFFASNQSNSNSLSNNMVNSVFDEPSYLWIGTAGGGLNRYSKGDKTFSHYRNSAHNQNSISSNFISAICKDPKGDIWVGTWGGGLNQLVTPNGGGVFRHFRENESPGIVSDFVSSVWADPKGFLLIGTLTGLDLFDQGKHQFRHIANQQSLKNRISEVGCILKDKKDYYWIGTRLGLYRVASNQLTENIQDKDIIRFTNTNGVTNTLPGDYVISLCEDNQGDIWVGTYGSGISRIHIAENGGVTFKSYSQSDGLCNNVVYAIQNDRNNNLWLSTDNGLSRFDLKTSQFKNFYASDGLQSNQFYWTASCTGADGRLYFGGVKGLNYFDPESIRDNTFIPQVLLTELKVFNSTVNVGKWNGKKVLLEKVINETSTLNLSYKENVFSFEFSSLDYFLPEKVQYKYRMQGVDKDWVTVPSSRRFVTYTNLEGGDYLFEVKACNCDGVWNNTPTKLKLHISPPFWATVWFRILLLLFVTGLVLGYIRYRTIALHRQKIVLERLVRERTRMVEEQNETLQSQAQSLKESNTLLASGKELIEGQKSQLEMQNLEISDQRDKLIELNEHVKLVNQFKLRFFTNISHEFRTPLTLILDPLESLLKKLEGDKESTQTLRLINRNAQRLLHLINQLMNFRRIETGKIELRVAKGDLTGFLNEIFVSFQDLANHQKIRYSFDAEDIHQSCWFDPEKIENIFYNLLSNAFKFTPENGQISMKVRFCEPHQNLQELSFPYISIEIRDTGKGIAEAHLPYLFDRFYQAESSTENREKGSGIGLALTQELVKAIHGLISVESKINQGSTFTVLLPYRSEDFAENELDLTADIQLVNIQSKVDVISEEILHADVPEEADPLQVDKSKPLILIVEDNYDLRNFMLHSLNQEYRIMGAENGKEGFELAKKYTPDLIISDIMMPVMDGLELCSRVKKELHTSHIPVILLTAKAMIEHWIEGLETGADDYIPKPFNLQVLQARIQNLIDGRRRLKKRFSSPQETPGSDLAGSPIDEEFISKAYAILEKSYRVPEFSASQFASEMFVSRSLLYKKIRAITDLNITDFINSFKLRKAVELIRENKQPIADIAFNVGFNDPKYFSRIFRKFYGMSPSEFHSQKTS